LVVVVVENIHPRLRLAAQQSSFSRSRMRSCKDW
jgi:hypothetical protein